MQVPAGGCLDRTLFQDCRSWKLQAWNSVNTGKPRAARSCPKLPRTPALPRPGTSCKSSHRSAQGSCSSQTAPQTSKQPKPRQSCGPSSASSSPLISWSRWLSCNHRGSPYYTPYTPNTTTPSKQTPTALAALTRLAPSILSPHFRAPWTRTPRVASRAAHSTPSHTTRNMR